MLTEKQLELKQKDFSKWARNDAKYAVFKNKSNETIDTYFARIIEDYKPERLIAQFNYSSKQADYILSYYNIEFWRGYEYWKNKKEKIDAVIAKYQPILTEAEKYAETIDVSDLSDGFPCGYVHLYLADKKSELAKAISQFNNGSTDAYKYALPIKLPSNWQCITFSERICEKVKEFLETRKKENV